MTIIREYIREYASAVLGVGRCGFCGNAPDLVGAVHLGEGKQRHVATYVGACTRCHTRWGWGRCPDTTTIGRIVAD